MDACIDIFVLFLIFQFVFTLVLGTQRSERVLACMHPFFSISGVANNKWAWEARAADQGMVISKTEEL
jgi:hypothetical protein